MIEWYADLKNFLGGRDPIFTLLEYVGTFAAAVSGIRLASIRSFDWFGAYVIGFVTALGGGTLRDAMFTVTPFWVQGPSYLICTFLALVSVWLFGRKFISEQITWFVFDTIGLSIFTVIGLQKSLMLGFSWWVAIMMGTITGAAGGVMRDVLVNEVPLIFRKEIYALACAVGGVSYFAIRLTGTDDRICGVICVAVIFVIRALAIKYHLGVPVLSGRDHLHHHGGHRGPTRNK